MDKKKIVFMNFWNKGCMKHYSDSLARVIAQCGDLTYMSGYETDVACAHKQYTLDENPFKIHNLISSCAVLRDLLRLKPDIVHMNNGLPTLFLFYPVFRWYNSCVTIHDALPHEGEPAYVRWYHIINFLLIALFFKRIIIHSVSMRKDLPWFLRKKKICIVPHVSLNESTSRVNEHTKRKDRTKVLFLGRILAYKGLEYLVEAFNHLEEDAFELTVAGKGQLPDNLKEKKNVVVINRFLTDDEVREFFLETDVVVVPYVSASQSGVVHMAFNYKRPVIASDISPLNEVVRHKVNGMLVPARDVNGLVNALQYVHDVDNYHALKKNISRTMRDQNVVRCALNEAYN